MKFDQYRDQFIEQQKKIDPDYEKKYWKGYETFKVGVLLKQARTEVGMTQEQVAKKINTTRSAISRIENHSKDVKLSTLEKFAEALGKRLSIAIE